MIIPLFLRHQLCTLWAFALLVCCKNITYSALLQIKHIHQCYIHHNIYRMNDCVSIIAQVLLNSVVKFFVVVETILWQLF